MTPGDRTYRNQAVRLADLTVLRDSIRDVTFESCHIIGPAVIALINSSVTGNNFSGDPEGLLWPLGERTHVIGAVALVNCTIANCRIDRVGLLVPDAQMDQIRRDFGLPV